MCDVDGLTSSAILWLYIKSVYPQANLSFIMHEHKQHGLDDKIDWIENNNEKWDLMVVPDAGSFDIDEHMRLNQLGTDCLVLDHHMQEYDTDGNPIVSNAPRTVIVNNQLSPKYMNKTLCGAGVVYKFCEILDEMLGISHAHNYIDLAALGEIADVMDKTDVETNYIITEGLKHIENDGLRTLIEAQEYTLKDKAKPPYHGLTSTDIAFYIAPLLNAIIRVGTAEEKMAAFYCFIEPYRPLQSTKRGAKLGETECAAEQTARVGKNAKARQDRIKEQALNLIDFKIQKNGLDDNNIIFVEVSDIKDLPSELTGLVAMNLVSKYHKPVILGRLNDTGEIQGSLRSDGSFAGLPSFKAFLENSKLIIYVAGHDAAAGIGISVNKIDTLIDYANKTLDKKDFETCYIVDYILDAEDNNGTLVRSLASHPEYFGNHIEEIKFVVENIPITDPVLMGANKDSVKISYNGIDYVRFKDSDFAMKVLENKTQKLTIYGRANLNYWGGRTSIQVFVDDYELRKDDHKYDF